MTGASQPHTIPEQSFRRTVEPVARLMTQTANMCNSNPDPGPIQSATALRVY